METPYFNYDEFKEDFINVYEPAEDSFLLLDALQNDAQLIKGLNPSICMEIGSGSGILITSLACLLRHGFFLSTDINHLACETTLKCAKNNRASGRVEAVNTDLSNCLDDKLKDKVDILIFNPPYVPTEDSEITESLLSRSYAGGRDGRVVVDRFLSQCLSLLSNNGLLYLLLIKENKPDEIVKQLNKISGFDAEIVLKRKTNNETQYIIRSRKHTLC